MLGRPGKIICKTIDWGVMVVVAIFKSLAQTYQRQENREQYQTMPHLKISTLIILTLKKGCCSNFGHCPKIPNPLFATSQQNLPLNYLLGQIFPRKKHGVGLDCNRLLSLKATMILTSSLPLKTHPKEHNKHEDLEEGAEDMRVTAQK